MLLNFLGISKPFCDLKYDRVAEFKVDKQSQGRLNDNWLMRNVKSVFKRWQSRWVVLGPNNIFYYETSEDAGDKMRDSVPIDTETTVTVTEANNDSLVLDFIMSRRTLRIRIEEPLAGFIGLHYVAKVFRRNQYAKPHRFESFAPIREKNDCTFYHDGEEYFRDMFNALEKCTNSVMITDWWFSPEMPLLRPIQNTIENEPSRIDRTLKRAAERGVKVYVIVYKEFSMSMSNDSEHVKQTLEALHSNIKVLRHPNVIVSLWSHHEKMCLIDRSIVFMGGLDLCWGRWDSHKHPLFNDPQNKNYPVVDYYNPLKKDVVQGRQYQKSMIDSNYPRMPWHDIAVQLRGRIANDYVNHFNTYWNHARETNAESEVLFVKKISPGAPLAPPQIVDDEGRPVQPEAVDPYENTKASSQALQSIALISDNPDPNSILEPQVNLFQMLKAESATENGKYKVKFLQVVKEEMDKQLQISENDRSKTQRVEGGATKFVGVGNTFNAGGPPISAEAGIPAPQQPPQQQNQGGWNQPQQNQGGWNQPQQNQGGWNQPQQQQNQGWFNDGWNQPQQLGQPSWTNQQAAPSWANPNSGTWQRPQQQPQQGWGNWGQRVAGGPPGQPSPYYNPNNTGPQFSSQNPLGPAPNIGMGGQDQELFAPSKGFKPRPHFIVNQGDQVPFTPGQPQGGAGARARASQQRSGGSGNAGDLLLCSNNADDNDQAIAPALPSATGGQISYAGGKPKFISSGDSVEAFKPRPNVIAGEGFLDQAEYEKSRYRLTSRESN